MELRANCKINLGLRVLRRRCEPHGRYDGFHDIETVMVPVRGLFDTLSVTRLPATGVPHSATGAPHCAGSLLEVSGAGVDCPPEKNICMRALRLMQREFGTGTGGGKARRSVGDVVIRLHKNIPAGAGLGGGSSDAAFTLRALNEEFALGLPDARLERLGAELGSDVPFFVRGTPQLCTGRGEVMSPVEVDLSGLWLAILKPASAVSTAEAYAGIIPRENGFQGIAPPHAGTLRPGVGTLRPGATITRPDAGLPLAGIVRREVGEWRELLVNDFEESVFARHPEIGELKGSLYEAGALYASMSGSGSAVFGIFDSDPKSRLQGIPGAIFCHIEQPGS